MKKTYKTAYDERNLRARKVALLPVGRQAYVFDEVTQKWFLATSNGHEWVREI